MKLICAIFPNLERIIIPNLPKKLLLFACGTNFIRNYNFWCASISILPTHEKWKNSTSYFAFLSFPCPFKCAKKFMLQNNPFSCLNAINYFYSLAAGIKINVFTEKRNGLLRQSFLLFPLWPTAVFGRSTSPGIDQTALQWDQILF